MMHARNVLWSVDATHLGRDPKGAKVEGEVVREVAFESTNADRTRVDSGKDFLGSTRGSASIHARRSSRHPGPRELR